MPYFEKYCSVLQFLHGAPYFVQYLHGAMCLHFSMHFVLNSEMFPEMHYVMYPTYLFGAEYSALTASNRRNFLLFLSP